MIFNTSSTIIQSVNINLFCHSSSILPLYLTEALKQLSDIAICEVDVSDLAHIPQSGGLVWDGQKLVFIWPEKAVRPIYFDFDEWVKVLQRTGYKNSHLLRAVGIKAELVIDSTTGTARDSLTLLLGGHCVQSWERDPIVYLLLIDAFYQMINESINKDLWEIKFGDVFKTNTQAAVLYYDPMFDRTGKTALARKEMMLFHQILKSNGEENESQLADWMRTHVKRLIVKRPLKGEVFPLSVTAQFKGKSVRFDLHQLG